MKTVTKEILGFNVPVTGVAESLDEAVQLAGGDNARVLDAANNYILFHQHFGKLRTTIVKKLEELTGVAREKDKDGKITEKDAEYIGRLEDSGIQLAQYESQIAEVVGALPVDYKQAVRGTGEGSAPAKKWLAYYDAMVEEGKLEAFATKQGLELTGDVEQDKVLVANKVKEIVTLAQRQALAAAANV